MSTLMSIFLSILSALMLAIEIIFIRKSTVSGDPMDAVAITMWVNVLIFLPLSLILYYPDISLDLKTVLVFGAAGVSGTFLTRMCLYHGTKKVGASISQPIFKGDLLVSSLIAILFLGETVTSGHILGIFFLTVGVATVSYEMESNSSESNYIPPASLLLPLGAMVFSGISRPISKIGLNGGTPVELGLAIKFSIALLTIISYYLIRGKSPLRPFRVPERSSYALAGVFASVGMWFFYFALKTSDVVIVIPFWSLSPLFVLILSYIFLQKLESITKVLVLGTILVIIGAALTGIFL